MAQLSPRGKIEIQCLLSNAVKEKRTSGLVFGATNVEKELFFAHAGSRVFHDVESGPITEDSIFWICSQTKMLASIATFQLIEAGKLTLDTDVAGILPELAHPIVVGDSSPEQLNYRPPKSNITIRHLLNHSSGLDYGSRVCESHIAPPYLMYHEKLDPIRHFFNQRKGLYPTQPLESEPGTSFAYGYGPDALGFIVEKLTGQSLEEYYKRNIFLPIGITTASFYLNRDLKEQAVSMSYREADGTVVPWNDQVPLPEQDPKKVHCHLSGGLFYCSMRGYLALLRHLLQIKSGTVVNPILSSASVDTFFEPTLAPTGVKRLNEFLNTTDQQWSTALCLNTVDIPGRRRKGSAWWWVWAGTYHVIDPETGVALVFGSQLVPSPDIEAAKIWKDVEEAFYRNI